MRIKDRMGMSVDGYIATTDGTPWLDSLEVVVLPLLLGDGVLLSRRGPGVRAVAAE